MSNTAFQAAAFPTIRNADAERELEAARHRGYAAGYVEGTRAAEREALARQELQDAQARAEREQNDARLAAAVAVLAAATQALHARILPTITEVEDTLAAASIDLAEAVLGVELSHGDTSARAALRRALGHPDAALATAVRLNPADLALLTDGDLAAAGVALTGDPGLAPGDAIADLPVGFLDARISSALDRARRELLGPS